MSLECYRHGQAVLDLASERDRFQLCTNGDCPRKRDSTGRRLVTASCAIVSRSDTSPEPFLLRAAAYVLFAEVILQVCFSR